MISYHIYPLSDDTLKFIRLKYEYKENKSEYKEVKMFVDQNIF